IQSNGFEPSKFGRSIFGGRGWLCGGGGGGGGGGGVGWRWGLEKGSHAIDKGINFCI
ncbi:hypothetical protein Tco_1099299, partial [Tanacetum coccineum]